MNQIMRVGTSHEEARGRMWPACRPVLLCLLGIVAVEREARAYTDPGTGALLWQMLAAAFVGALFYFRKFTSWLSRRKQKDVKD